MPQIKSITDMRNAGEISDLRHETQETIYVTKNGQGDMVVMSLELFECFFEKALLYIRAVEAETDKAQGNPTTPETEVFAGLRAKYGN